MEAAACSRGYERRGACFEGANGGLAGAFRLDMASFRCERTRFDGSACFDAGVTGSIQRSVDHIAACFDSSLACIHCGQFCIAACGDGCFAGNYLIQLHITLGVYSVAVCYVGHIHIEAAALSHCGERRAACGETANGGLAGAFRLDMASFRCERTRFDGSACFDAGVTGSIQRSVDHIAACFDSSLACIHCGQFCIAACGDGCFAGNYLIQLHITLGVYSVAVCYVGRIHREAAVLSRCGKNCAACSEGADGGGFPAFEGGPSGRGDGGHVESTLGGDGYIAFVSREVDFLPFFPAGLGFFRIGEGEAAACSSDVCRGEGSCVRHAYGGAAVGTAVDGAGIGYIGESLSVEAAACDGACVMDGKAVILSGAVCGECAAGDAAGGEACFICSLHAFIGDGSGLADEGAAGDGAFRRLGGGVFCRIVHGERAGRCEGTACDGTAARHIERIGTDICTVRNVAEEGDVAVAGSISDELTWYRFLRFGSRRTGDLDTEGIVVSFPVFRAVGAEIRYLSILSGNGDILTLDIDEGGALDLLTRFVVGVIAAFAVDAGAVCYREFHVSFRSVDRMDYQVAALLGERDAILGPGSEDAVTFGDGDIRNLSFPGFENDLVIGTNRDAGDVAACFEAEFVIGEKFTSLIVAVFGDQVEAAFQRLCGDRARSVCRDGRHGAHGNLVAVDFEVAPFCRRESEEFCGRKVFQISCGEINLHAFRLLSDAAGTLISIGIAFGNEGDIHAGYMRYLLDSGICIGNAFLDAAGSKGDKEILRRFRRAYENACFLILREEIIAFQCVLSERGAAVDGVLARPDAVGVGFHVICCPGIYAGLDEAIVFRLALRDVSIRIDSILAEDISFRVREGVRAVLHIRCQRLVTAVLLFHFVDEHILLLRDGLFRIFQDCLIGPAEELRLRVFIFRIGEVVIYEAAARGECHIACFRSDAVEVEIAAGVFDGNIAVRISLETCILRIFLASSENLERRIARAGDGAAFRGELDAFACKEGACLLGDASRGGDGRSPAGSDRAGGDAVVSDGDREISSCRTGEMGRIRLDGASCGAGVSRSIHDEGACRNESAVLHNIVSGNRGGAGRIGNIAAYVHILVISFDTERAAGVTADKADADVVVCFHRGLLDGGMLRGLFEFHIPLLRQAQGVPETLRADIPFLHRLTACFVKSHFRLGPVTIVAGLGLAGFRILHHAAAGHVGTAVQHGRRARIVPGLLAANVEQFLQCRLFIFDAPPVGTGAVIFVGLGDARIGTGLVGVPLTCRGVILVRRGTGLCGIGEISVLVIAEGFHFCFDLPILPGIGGGSRLAAAVLPVEVGDLDLPFHTGAGREIDQFQIFARKIFHLDRAVSVKCLDLAFAVLAGIENGPYDGYTAAIHFDAGESEPVIGCVIGEVIGLRIIAGFIGHGRHDVLSALDADVNRRPGHFLRFRFGDFYRFSFPVSVVEHIVLGNGHVPVSKTALDLGIDIHIAGADENIAIGKDSRAHRILHIAGIIDGGAADIGHALIRFRAEGLDVVAVGSSHIDGARIEGPIVVHIAAGACHGEPAAGIVHDPCRSEGRRREDWFAAHHVVLIFRRTECALYGDLRLVCGVSRFHAAGKGRSLVLVDGRDARFHIACRPLEGAVIVEYHAAQACSGGAALAHYIHIAHDEVVRRAVGDRDRGVAACLEGPRAGYGICFEMDVPELGCDVANVQVMSEALVRHRMEERVLFAIVGVLRHFLAIQVEMAILFCASILYESICRRHLVLLIGDTFDGAAIDALFRNKSVPFGLDDLGIEAGRVFGVLRIVRRIVGFYLVLVAGLRGPHCGLRFLILAACCLPCRIGCREGRISRIVRRHCFVVLGNYLC